MKLKKNKKIVVFIVFSLVLVLLCGIVLYKEKNDIDNILKTKHYSYLPKEAQNYIKEVYEETGELILTESNKVVNEPYLNPRYVSYLQLSNEQKQNVSLIPNLYSVDYVFAGSDSSNQEFPKSYNLENVDGKNYTSPMYNQGSLGTCWAFATIENAESHLMIQKDEPRNVNSTRFSVRQLDYAASTDGIKGYENPWGVAPLALGGNFVYATTLMANGLSLVADEYMPYVETVDQKPLHEIHNYSNSLYEVNGTANLPNFGKIELIVSQECEDADDWYACYDEVANQLEEEYINIIKDGIMNYGGIYLGAYDPTGSCGALNSDGYYVLDPNQTCFPMNSTASADEAHAMQIIGWDDDYEYSYCKSRNHSSTVDGECESGVLTQGTGAWLVKNSWGENNTPYTYLTYNSVQSNFVDFAYITSMTEMSERNWDNVYNNGKISSSNVAKLTQTFDKKLFNEEKIQKIKFHTILMNEEYSISVVANGNTYLITDSFKTEYPGLYTVDVTDKDIFIQTGDFEVIIEGTKQSINKNSISVFTKNMDNQQLIVTDVEKDIDSNKFTIYSETRNIPSNTEIEYELYKGNEKLENVMEVTNNIVAANNVNAEISLIKKIEPGEYKLVQKTNDIKVSRAIDIGTILDGAGTEENPFKIYTEEDLKYIHKHLDSYYKLENDIELTSEWVPIGTKENPFTGAFDGNNHKIINLQVDDSTLEYAGLFGYVKDSDEHQTYIKNIYLVNPNIVADYYAGGLIGYIYITQTGTKSALIDSIYIIGGNIEGKQASGLVANIFGTFKEDLTINNIFSSATIKGKIKSSLIGMHLLGNDTGNNKGVSISNIQNVGVMYDNGKTSLINSNSSINAYSLSNYIFTGYSKKHNSINQFYDTPVHDIDDVDETKGYVLARSDSTYTFPSIIMKVTDITELKNTSKYSDWGDDFNTYWEIKEEDGVTRIPTLKGVDLDYTESIDDINVEFGNDIALSDYISSELITRRLNVTTEDNDIIEISKEYNPSEAYPHEIIISPLKQGTATIHVVSDYDGFEKDINIVVYKKELTITYHDGLDMITQTIINGVPVNLMKNKFVRGNEYIFVGWNTQEDGTGTSYSNEQEVTITEDLDLYAQWERKLYLVTFDANDGMFTGGKTTIVVDEWDDTKLETLERPIREGYEFKGFFTEKEGGTSLENYIAEAGIDKDGLIFYAQWERESYSVTFDANDGIFTDDKTTIVIDEWDDTKLETLERPIRSGYEFKGFFTEKEGGTSLENYIAEFGIDKDGLVFYAQWEKVKHILSFDANGGIGNMENQIFTYGDMQKISKNIFTKEGYKFKEWNTKVDGTGDSYTDEQEISITENLTLYAIWEESYSYVINKYTVDEDNKYIDLIDIGTTVDEFKNNLDLNDGYTVDVEYKSDTGENLIYTGGKTRIYKGDELYVEYTNIIRGDVNGNGIIDIIDYIRIMKHIMEEIVLEDEFFKAADISQVNGVDIIDYIRIMKMIMEEN